MEQHTTTKNQKESKRTKHNQFYNQWNIDDQIRIKKNQKESKIIRWGIIESNRIKKNQKESETAPYNQKEY